MGNRPRQAVANSEGGWRTQNRRAQKLRLVNWRPAPDLQAPCGLITWALGGVAPGPDRRPAGS
jgi:hypothetical protein